jgi:hypothetical protein
MASRRRPEGWSKESALEWARAHAGATLPDVARAFATAECSWQPLAYDLHCFRGEDPEFREEFDRLIPTTARGHAQELELEPGMDDWKVRWARAYLETEDKIEASGRVGLSWSTVQTYLRARHRNFDTHFKELHDQVESWFLASDEADLRVAARIARETADARTLAWISLERLGRLERKKWGKNETVTHEGSVEHRHVHEINLAHTQITERFAHLFGRPVAALPPPPTVITLPAESVKVLATA